MTQYDITFHIPIWRRTSDIDVSVSHIYADSVDHHIWSSPGIHGFKASPGIELLDMNSIYG